MSVEIHKWHINKLKNYNTNLSAPAQDNILLMRLTWKGCKRTRRWKASLPQFFTKYLLAQIRPASKASDESCSYSSEIRCTQSGNSSTRAFLRPKSKIRIFGSVGKEKEKEIKNTSNIQNLQIQSKTSNKTTTIFVYNHYNYQNCVQMWYQPKL